MGVREVLWLIGLALVGYSVWQFFRALRAPRSRTAAPPEAAERTQAESPRAAVGGVALAGGGAEQPISGAEQADAEAEDDDAFADYAPLPGRAVGPAVGPGPVAARAQSDAAGVQSDAVRSEVFQLELENSRLRQALQAQRDLVALQQDEIDRLVHDITTLQDELERLREQPTSSPEYSEALTLAAQGLNAEMIAVRCGITLAEAELVLSLARRGEGPA